MELELKMVIFAAIFVLIFALVSSAVLNQEDSSDLKPFQGSWACTTDVKLCPDGTTVNRTPPYCQFAPC